MVHIVYRTQMKNRRMWGRGTTDLCFCFVFETLKSKKCQKEKNPNKFDNFQSFFPVPLCLLLSHSNPSRLRHESLRGTLNCTYKWRRSKSVTSGRSLSASHPSRRHPQSLGLIQQGCVNTLSMKTNEEGESWCIKCVPHLQKLWGV